MEQTLQEALFSEDERGKPINLVDALYAIAGSIDNLAHAIHRLGTNNAATPMGAIETHAVMVKEAAETIASALIEAGDR